MAAYPASLLHGDLKFANLGFDAERVVILDWGSVTGMGPRATDHAWYLAINGATVASTLDELLADIACCWVPMIALRSHWRCWARSSSWAGRRHSALPAMTRRSEPARTKAFDGGGPAPPMRLTSGRPRSAARLRLDRPLFAP